MNRPSRVATPPRALGALLTLSLASALGCSSQQAAPTTNPPPCAPPLEAGAAVHHHDDPARNDGVAAPSSNPASETAHAHSEGDVAHSHALAHVASPDAVGAAPPLSAPPRVVKHDTLPRFQNNGNDLVGIATASLGAREHEVWRTSVAVGSSTPAHTHTSEEIFIFLRGTGQAKIGEATLDFEAPATVIAPAGVAHQFTNTGDVPTDAIVVVSVGSHIHNADGARMQLPWRR